METKKPLWKTAVMYLRYIVSVPLILLFGLFALTSGVSFISGLIIGDYGNVFIGAAMMVLFGTAFILIFPKFDNFLNKHIKFLQNPIINLILRFVMMGFVFIICISAVGFNSIYLQPPCHNSDNEGKCLINNKPLMCVNNTAIMKASVCGCRANETVSGEKCVARPVQKTETQTPTANAPTKTYECSDGTPGGSCSSTKPMFCTASGVLIPLLDMCGCPAICDDGIATTTDICNANTNYECTHPKTLDKTKLKERIDDASNCAVGAYVSVIKYDSKNLYIEQTGWSSGDGQINTEQLYNCFQKQAKSIVDYFGENHLSLELVQIKSIIRCESYYVDGSCKDRLANKTTQWNANGPPISYNLNLSWVELNKIANLEMPYNEWLDKIEVSTNEIVTTNVDETLNGVQSLGDQGNVNPSQNTSVNNQKTENNDTKLAACKSLSTSEAVTGCIMSLARSTVNPNYCLELSNSTLKETCLSDENLILMYPTCNNDPLVDFCSYISADAAKNTCYVVYATITQKTDWCNKIQNASKRDACITKIVSGEGKEYKAWYSSNCP
ncbi:MAG: hypothetical protein NTX79_01755 [Candidatus Micrarchaeota archaeon]|nr:hypothetical protein [Candidatus Micrarchaeota archaeon]